jgi:uncharacterized protein YPO0396
MLDEAFTQVRRDLQFAVAPRAFEQFGFQPIIAAPIRMVGIVEPFIGKVTWWISKSVTPVRSDARAATFGELTQARATSDRREP